MSIPAMLELLATKLLASGRSTEQASVQHQILKQQFLERVLCYHAPIASDNSPDDDRLALAGLLLSWRMAQRRDHADAFQLLLDRLDLCQHLPSVYGRRDVDSSLHLRPVMPDIAFTEKMGVIRLLYRLYVLNHPSFQENQLSFNPHLHHLTKYAEELLRNQDLNLKGDKTNVGWFFSTGRSHTDTKLSHTHLSINDTYFDTIWTELISNTNPLEATRDRASLRHPVFSPSAPTFFVPTPSLANSAQNPSAVQDHASKHHFEALGSLYGALRFAHASVVPPSELAKIDPLHSKSATGSFMRIDIQEDRVPRLELPSIDTSEEVPDWLKLQQWKPESLFGDTLSLSTDTSDSVESETVAVMAPEAVSKPITVAEFIERTWQGAAGPLSPWRAQHLGGIAAEEDPLEWKDRLVDRARLLNVISESVVSIMTQFLDHIRSLYPDSVYVSTAFFSAVRKFINHWRGELLFAAHQDMAIEPICMPPLALQQVLPALALDSFDREFGLIELDQETAEGDAQATSDFMKSFGRVVSCSGSHVQISFLHSLVLHTLQVSSDEGTLSSLPVGAELLNRLYLACVSYELDGEIVRGIALQVLSLTMVPMARYLSEWLFWGVLPPHSEFMIQQADQAQQQSTQDSPAWLSRISIRPSHVPIFLQEHAQLILKTGVLCRIYRQLLATGDPHKEGSAAMIEASHSPATDANDLPQLRPVWLLSDLEKYYNNISSSHHGIGMEEFGLSERARDTIQALARSGSDRIFSVEQALYESFVVPLQTQFQWISPRVCSRMLQDWKLLAHLERLKEDYLDHLVSASFDALPLGVDLLDEAASSHSLDRMRVLFAENAQSALEKRGYRLALEKIPKCVGIDLADNILIEPTYMCWPLTEIITPEHLKNYNAVFVLLLKMTRTKAALTSIWTKLAHATRLAHRERAAFKKKSGPTSPDESIFRLDFDAIFQSLHKASTFCHQLLGFWMQMYTFIINQVVHTCFAQLRKDIEGASHFEDLVTAHDRYVASMMKCSLLNPNSRAVMVVIEKTFHLVHKFRQQIKTSFADPSKWEERSRAMGRRIAKSAPSSTLALAAELLPDDGESIASDMDRSIFERESYQTDVLDQLVSSTKTEFEKCARFLMAVLLKLLSRGFEPHLAALVSSINWNKYYFSGAEFYGQGSA